ncbi:MAG: VCBS repeat-containing protein [Planctomycetes bacterium]|nr:VCBS repeat-containing protein [Planctomycetota bacterium]
MHAKALLLSSTLLSAALAQNAPPPIPVELRARFGFEGPLVTKVGDGIGSLQLADLDGDGKREAIVFDGRRARLAVVRVKGNETVLEPVPTEGQIAGYTYGDVHGDGKADLLVVDSRGRLIVRDPSGKPGTPIDLGLGGRGVGMRCGDLDGDGKQDLVALTRGSLRWVTKLASAPALSAIETIEENAQSFDLLDLDGDRKLDLVYVVPGPTLNVRLRLGRGDGTFGPWRITGVDMLHGLFATKLPDGATALATIEGPHRRVALQQFADQGGQAPLEWWPLGEAQGQKALPWALGDVDNDGDQDLVLAQPEKAQLLVFQWSDGTFVLRTVPTLAGVTSVSLGDVDQDGKLDLVLTSAEEDTLAWKPGTAPLDQFPVQIACTDKPVVAAVDPELGIVVLARTEKREAHLDRARPGSAPERLADLGRLPADPARLLVADVGDAPGREAAYVVPGEGLRVVTIALPAEGAARPKPSDAAGFTKKMEDGSLALCQQDGAPALLAVRERFVRRFRVDDKAQLRVLAQDNGPEGLAELSLAALLADGNRLYLDKKNNKLVRAVPGGAVTSIDVPAYDFTHLLAHGDAALLVGPRGVLRVPFGSGPTLRTVSSHEPPTERTYYWAGRSGDFDHDGVQDLAVLDGRLPGVQILAGGKQGLLRALAIPVYEAPPSQEPENEPRELRVADLNGDGRDDLVLLAFDRVLIYLQEK